MLLHFSDDKNLVVAGRQYPFKTNTGLEKVFDFIRTIFSPDANPYFNHWCGWVDLVEEVKTMQGFQVLNSPYMLIDGFLYKLTKRRVEKRRDEYSFLFLLPSSFSPHS